MGSRGSRRLHKRGTVERIAKEVEMLDKFRGKQIHYFDCLCFIPTHVMMVTEFAPCGSLNDCIKKQSVPSERIKAKVMLDTSRVLEYLHENWIIHRDIHPDNVLVFSLDEVFSVNVKLMDFGSSRNVNLLTTDMTFRNGVGTPQTWRPRC